MTGAKVSDKTLDDALFAVMPNQTLMHRAIVMRLANKRNPIAHVQTRGEVSRTKKKAFRQKGTGRARRGSLTTNLIRGGGAAFGPRVEKTNYTKGMNKKERRAALFSSLSQQAIDKQIFGLDTGIIETPKTKPFAELMAKLPEGKKYLFVLPRGSYAVQKSVQNLANVRVILAQYLNPYDVLWADQVCFVNTAVEALSETFNQQK